MPDDNPKPKKYLNGTRYEDALAELNRRTAENQADVGSTADWFRHTWPVIALLVVAGIGLLLAALLLIFDPDSSFLEWAVIPGPAAILGIAALGMSRRPDNR
jgi:hypothetical protein